MQYGLKVDIAFGGAKTLVGCREQLAIKDSEFESKVLHSLKTANWNQKKKFLFEKNDKNVQSNSLFLGNS